jgi:AraC-like DNA-binding protein
MSFDNVYMIINFSGIILGIICVCILLFSNKTHTYVNRLLAISTFVLVINMTVNALLKTDFFIRYPHFFRSTSPLLYMFMPLAYMYIRGVLKDETRFRKWDWVFFIPAFLHICELFPFYIKSTEEKRYFISVVLTDPSKLNNLASYMLSPHTHNILKAALGFVFMIFAFRLLRIYRPSASKRLSTHYKIIYRWLMIYSITLMTMIVLILFFSFVTVNDRLQINTLMMITVSVVYVLSLYLLFVPTILFGLPKLRTELILAQANNSNAGTMTFSNPVIGSVGTTIGSSITENLAIGNVKEVAAPAEHDFTYLEAYKPLLEMHLEMARPYLTPGYALGNLCKETGIPEHHLSALLNKGYGTRFNDFINKQRLNYLVQHFKPEWEKFTLEGIAREIGFNSRTTFFNTIKKNTGLSPTAFFEQQKHQFMASGKDLVHQN